MYNAAKKDTIFLHGQLCKVAQVGQLFNVTNLVPVESKLPYTHKTVETFDTGQIVITEVYFHNHRQ